MDSLSLKKTQLIKMSLQLPRYVIDSHAQLQPHLVDAHDVHIDVNLHFDRNKNQMRIHVSSFPTQRQGSSFLAMPIASWHPRPLLCQRDCVADQC